ncbi:MAG: hypothetical protein JW932_08110 [Deltaproteobacteria bacterium]|nr:hypothetical protein [Deltaproteobacteria bacterium]
MEFNRLIESAKEQGKLLLSETWKTSLILIKIIIPISIVTKLMNDWGLIKFIGLALGPVMECVGLPGSMGLVWATAMITNLYAAMIVFSSLAPAEHLTVAQVTVITTMMLLAHALPIELRIAQKAGVRFRFMFLLRILGALIIGLLLNQIYLRIGFLQTEYIALWNPGIYNPSWKAWAIDQVKTLLSIYGIILLLFLIVKVLTWLRITDLLARILEPVLRLMGMSKDTVPITIIGMTMGIGYGGGLIIREAQSGRLSKKDIFFSLSFMGLMHSMIEDTLLMLLLGGHISGVLIFRFLFAMLVIFVMVKFMRRIPDRTFDRYLFRTAVDKGKHGSKKKQK